MDAGNFFLPRLNNLSKLAISVKVADNAYDLEVVESDACCGPQSDGVLAESLIDGSEEG